MPQKCHLKKVIMKYILTAMFICSSLIAFSQIRFNYRNEKKDAYQIGDEIDLVIQLQSQPQTCKDGMRQAKVFVSGLSIETQGDWVSPSKGLWLKQITLRVTGNDKGKAKLTVMRKVDKESLFHQETFAIKESH